MQFEVLVLGLYIEVYLLFFKNICPLECTTVVGSGKLQPLKTLG